MLTLLFLEFELEFVVWSNQHFYNLDIWAKYFSGHTIVLRAFVVVLN